MKKIQQFIYLLIHYQQIFLLIKIIHVNLIFS